ncbi:phage protein Gp36 family protein [Thermophagus sp. OGC60D27]|uniref:phage protein Gp36 family protein n=1 Tax=Thermophagus sp. OGC60D27 TaxID=3458415 RepID=UPI0040381565
MDFIQKEDYSTRVDSAIIDQITGGNDSLLDEAEKDAASVIIDRLGDKYNVQSELAHTGEDRDRSLMRWMISLSLYYIYARVPDEEIPERVIKDYDDTLSELDKIASGRYACNLARITNERGEATTSIRMGSNHLRTHNPYYL